MIPDSARPTDRFAASINSISHVIIDGFNYYQFLNMLSDGGIVVVVVVVVVGLGLLLLFDYFKFMHRALAY